MTARPLPSRRRLLAAALAAPLLGAGAQGEDTALVHTAEGPVRGVRAGGVLAFKGIPYAAPPLGPLRFRAPEPPPARIGVLEASAFRAAPIQPPPPAGLSFRAYLGAETSEDCLYLNVWRPEAPGAYPVFVWIHGGGNIGGSASQLADGAVFARSGVVCVTVGYRVGALGFLELGQILGPSYRGSGVNGLRDQIRALQWIRANVSAFGGDPDRVTVGGASAGAKNVVSLMASPLAKGLFSAAIVESGGQTVHDLAGAEAVAGLMMTPVRDEELRDALVSGGADRLNALQMALLKSNDRPFPFRAVIGTDVLPETPLSALRRGAFRTGRLLIGTNRDESISFIDRRTAADPLTQHDLANISLGAARPVAAAYDRAFPDLEPLRRRVRLVTAEEYMILSVRVADILAGGRQVFMYRFGQVMEAGPFAGWTPHGSEGIYAWRAFDTPLARLAFGPASPAARRLGEEVHDRWVAFISGGAPDVPGAAPWPVFDGVSLLAFGSDRSGRAALDRREVDLWAAAPLGALPER